MSKYNYRIILTIILLLLSLLSVLPYDVHATTTLDCSNDEYTVMVWVGSTGWFGEVTLYTPGGRILYQRDELSVAHVDYGKKELALEYNARSSERPNFRVDVKGEEGYLTIHNKKNSITCDWRT